MIQRHAGSAVLLLTILILVGITALAGGDTSDIDNHRSCEFCGMDRKAYGFSRMLIEYQDGAAAGVCSLHCAVVELDANKDRKIKALLVADREDRTLIPAETAIWLIGGSKRGVMTQRPKWAFRTLAAAENFVKTNGGTIITWNEALAAAREEAARELK